MTIKSSMWPLAGVLCASLMTLNLVACHSGSVGSGTDTSAASAEKAIIAEALITDKMVSIDGTPKTPTVHFDAVTGVLEIKGRSIPENSIEFYKLLTEWMDNYAKAPAKITKFNIWFSSIDQASSEALLAIFRKLESINKGGSMVVINWHYSEGNLNMLEAGEKYQSIINIHFKMVQVAERAR